MACMLASSSQCCNGQIAGENFTGEGVDLVEFQFHLHELLCVGQVKNNFLRGLCALASRTICWLSALTAWYWPGNDGFSLLLFMA
jgi:hypothetical protein